MLCENESEERSLAGVAARARTSSKAPYVAGKSLPALLLLLLALAAPACQLAARLALRARRRWRGRCAPGACGEPDLRLALRARRSAHGAARRGRCAPVCRAAPGGAAAGCHRRLALRARRRDGVQRLGPGRLYGSPVAASRCALGAEGVGAARPSAHMCSPGNAHVVSWGGGDVEDVVRFALLETLGATRASRSCRGRGWGGGLRHHHARACGGTLACYRSMCSVSRRGAPLQPERPTPRPGRPPAL